MIAFALALLFSSPASSGAAELVVPKQWSGSICVTTRPSEPTRADCSQTEGPLSLRSGTEAGQYYWISDDGAALRVGTINHDNAADLARDQVGGIKIRLGDSIRRNGNAPAILTFRTDRANWTIPLNALGASRLRMLYLPVERFSITFDVAGFEPATKRAIQVVQRRTIDIGEVLLRPMAEITGRVVAESDRAPLGGAAIDVSGTTVATSDATGRFAFVPRTVLPLSITITAPQFASKSVPVKRLGNGFDMGEVTLSRGSTLELKIARSCDGDCTTDVALLRRDELDPRSRWRPVAERRQTGASLSLTFTSLERSEYVARLSGHEPLQKISVPVSIREPAVSATVEIRDGRLTGSVSRDRAFLAGLALDVTTRERAWSATIRTDEHGQFDVPTWCQQALWVVTSVPGEQRKYSTAKAFGNESHQYWDIVIPATEIRGRVVDARTGQRIADATVSDSVVSGPLRRSSEPAQGDGDGHFRIAMAETGRHQLTASAPGYLETRPEYVDVREGEQTGEIELRLDRGFPVHLKIVHDDTGAAANAEIFDWFGADGMSTAEPHWADAFGVVRFDLRRDERKGLCVLADDGSFKIVTIDNETKSSAEAPLPVLLSRPTASLEVFVTAGGRPSQGVSLLIRYEGTFIPPGFLEQIAMLSRTPSATDNAGRIFFPHMPAGNYRVWPFRTYSQYQELLKTLRTTPPAAEIVAVPGANRMSLTLN